MNIKGVVATGHPQTTEVAQQVIDSGGNAFDAVVAAYFMACVTEPVLASLGGGGFMVAGSAVDEVNSLDFFVQTPLTKKESSSLDFEEITVDFGSTTQSFHMGYGCVAVPGCIKGMFEIQRRYCRLSMPELMAPAIASAKHGVVMTKQQSDLLNLVKPIYINRSSSRKLFVKSDDGSVLSEGQLFQNPDLAQVLDVLSIEGERFFYQGEIAQAINQIAQTDGGSITLEDLSQYEVKWREPLKYYVNGAQIYLNPPPSAGGMLVQFAIELMVAQENINFDYGSYDYYRTLAWAIELTQQARIEALSKSVDAELKNENLLNSDNLAIYKQNILNRHKSNNGTTHISVADKSGNVVSLTVSNGEGCGEILGDSGIMLNNMLGEDDLNPLGLNNWLPNRRLSSMMCPGIAVNNRSKLALGSGGSNRIRTAVLQVLINTILCELSLDDAISAARMHFDDKLYIESAGIEQSVIAALQREYSDLVLFPSKDFYFGGVNAVSIGKNHNQAVADPRRGGSAVIVS